MHVHILGIGGTFMAGVARLARELGHTVTGSDGKIYPPMSDQLAALGIRYAECYDPANLATSSPAGPDLVVVGNALSRGNPELEAVLDRGLPYTSGAQWVAEHVMPGRHVLAVAGTHGKTTTTGLLAWILEQAGLKPGFLVGGVPENFGVSARFGESKFFVIEADEYDTAFFDKRSKFVHYRPRTAILNNLEFDHADIFPDLAAIQRQFHHLVRTVPQTGLLVVNGHDPALAGTLAMGCWTPVVYFDDPRGLTAELIVPDGSRFRVVEGGKVLGEALWSLAGTHNVANALAALAAARHAGVAMETALAALATYQNVKRRLEIRAQVGGITVYDDFAHHPTAIALTLDALRRRVGRERIVSVFEARSNTMRMGVHRAELAPAFVAADAALFLQPPELPWPLSEVTDRMDGRGRVFGSVAEIVDVLASELKAGDHVLIMSNGGFENIHERLIGQLRAPA